MAFSDITLSAFLQQAELIEQYSAPQSVPHQRHVPKTPPLPDELLPPHRVKAAEIVQQFFGDAPAYVPRLKSREHPRPDGALPSNVNVSQSVLLPPLVPAVRSDAVVRDEVIGQAATSHKAGASLSVDNETQSTQPALFDAYETLAAMAAPQQRSASASPRSRAIQPIPGPSQPQPRSRSASPSPGTKREGADGKGEMSPPRGSKPAAAINAVPDVGKLLATASQSQAVRSALAAAVPELRVILQRLQQKGVLPGQTQGGGTGAGAPSSAPVAAKPAPSRSPSPTAWRAHQGSIVSRPAKGAQAKPGSGGGAVFAVAHKPGRKSISPQRTVPAVKTASTANIGPIATLPSSPSQASGSAASFVSRIPVLKGGRRGSATVAGAGGHLEGRALPTGQEVVTSVQAAIDTAVHATAAPPPAPVLVERVEMEVQTDGPSTEGELGAAQGQRERAAEPAAILTQQYEENGDAGAALLAELTQAVPQASPPTPAARKPFSFSPSAEDIPALESALAAAEAEKARALRNLRAAEEQLHESLPGEDGRERVVPAHRKVALWHALMTDSDYQDSAESSLAGSQSNGPMSPALDPVAQRLALVQRTLAAGEQASQARKPEQRSPATHAVVAVASPLRLHTDAAATGMPLSSEQPTKSVEKPEDEGVQVAGASHGSSPVREASESALTQDALEEDAEPVDVRLRAVERRYMMWKGSQADKARAQEAVFAALRSGSAIQAAQAPASVSAALQQALASARAQAAKQPGAAAAATVQHAAVDSTAACPAPAAGAAEAGMDGLIAALSLVSPPQPAPAPADEASQLVRTLQPAVGPQPSDRPRGAPYPEPMSPSKPAQAAVVRLGAGKDFQDPFVPGGNRLPSLSAAPRPASDETPPDDDSSAQGKTSRLDALVSSLASADMALSVARTTVRLAPRSQAPTASRIVPDPVLQHSPMKAVLPVSSPGSGSPVPRPLPPAAGDGETVSTVSKQESVEEESADIAAEVHEASVHVEAAPSSPKASEPRAAGIFSPQPAPPLHGAARAERPARHQRAGVPSQVTGKGKSRSPSKRTGEGGLDNSTMSGYMDRSAYGGQGTQDALSSVLGVMQAAPPAAPTPSLQTSAQASLLLSTALGQPRERALLRPNGGTYRPTGTLQGISMAASLPYILQPLGMSARLG